MLYDVFPHCCRWNIISKMASGEKKSSVEAIFICEVV